MRVNTCDICGKRISGFSFTGAFGSGDRSISRYVRDGVRQLSVDPKHPAFDVCSDCVDRYADPLRVKHLNEEYDVLDAARQLGPARAGPPSQEPTP